MCIVYKVCNDSLCKIYIKKWLKKYIVLWYKCVILDNLLFMFDRGGG